MNKKAFFFQTDNLLLPEDTPDSLMNCDISIELTKDFEKTKFDIFEVPSLNEPSCRIRAVSVPADTVLSSAWKSVPVRRILSLCADDADTAALVRACHLAQWRQNSRFCGACGAENSDVHGEVQRVCPKCGHIKFPRICPAVIVVITDDKDRILLAHNKKFRAGVYSLISGFNEAGETLENTVVREIREEVNIEVSDITYVKSQPWPFPNSLMIGFRARFLSGTVKPDGNEIETAQWFTRDNLPELPAKGSLSRDLIDGWVFSKP